MRQKKVQQAIFGQFLGFGFVDIALLVLNDVARQFDEVANHALDVAAHVAHLGEFAGLDLDERAFRELGQASGDLGFADAGGADHDDVLGRHVLRHLGRELLSAPAVSERNRHCPLGVFLADDVAVEFLDDSCGGEIFHQRVSTVMLLLV